MQAIRRVGSKGSSKGQNSSSNSDEEENDLYKTFRFILIFGLCLGLLPISNLFQKDVNKVRFRKISLASILSLVVSLWSAINVIMTLYFWLMAEKKNPSDIAWAASPLMFYINGSYIYAYYWKYSNDFIKLFQSWNKTTTVHKTLDTKLKRDIGILAGLMFTSGLLENVVWHLKRFPVFDHAEVVMHRFNISENASIFEVFYYRGYAYWGKFVSYNPFIVSLLFSVNKLILYAWNYSDILIALFSRAFYFKFKCLADTSIEKARSEKNTTDPRFWKNMIQDHNKLRDLLIQFTDFLSPLIFLSYVVNCFNTCLSLHATLTPSVSKSFGSILHAAWSMVHFIMKVMVITVYAARVQESAEKTLEVFYMCPVECYTQNIERAERSMQYETSIGLHGLKCFYVTKPLILSFISVLVTFEIVLLQATAVPGK